MDNDNKESFINDYKSERKKNINKKYFLLENSLNLSGFEKINNQPKIEKPPLKNNYHMMNNNKIYIEKNKIKKISIELKKSENAIMENKNFKLNLLDYLFMGGYKEKSKAYNLFLKGILIFKEKLDIMNLFNCILFIEKKCNFEEDYAK